MSDSLSGSHEDITDVPGIKVGHADDPQAHTGVTVILVPQEGARAGMYVGGSAVSTRQGGFIAALTCGRSRSRYLPLRRKRKGIGLSGWSHGLS